MAGVERMEAVGRCLALPLPSPGQVSHRCCVLHALSLSHYTSNGVTHVDQSCGGFPEEVEH